MYKVKSPLKGAGVMGHASKVGKLKSGSYDSKAKAKSSPSKGYDKKASAYKY